MPPQRSRLLASTSNLQGRPLRHHPYPDSDRKTYYAGTRRIILFAIRQMQVIPHVYTFIPKKRESSVEDGRVSSEPFLRPRAAAVRRRFYVPVLRFISLIWHNCG